MLGIFVATALGIVTGYVLCYLMTASQVADHPQELAEAYWAGFKAAQAKPGVKLVQNVRAMDKGVED